MRYKEFRDFKITRNCAKNFSDYKKYRPYLRADFQQRCGYCNLQEKQITTPFEIDHFIPRKVFQDVRPELEYTYDNLVFACKKCNLAKWDLFEGDMTAETPENTRFYDPVRVDFNTIFYRTEVGAIHSDDEKGRRMISDLKLYRPIHNLAWICEEIAEVLKRLAAKVDKETNAAKKEILRQARYKLMEYYIECSSIFIASYNDPKLTGEAYENPEHFLALAKYT